MNGRSPATVPRPPRSCTCTRFGCDIEPARVASRLNRSRNSGSEAYWLRRILTATSRESVLSCAMNTSAIAPAPIGSPRRYRSARSAFGLRPPPENQPFTPDDPQTPRPSAWV